MKRTAYNFLLHRISRLYTYKWWILACIMYNSQSHVNFNFNKDESGRKQLKNQSAGTTNQQDINNW